MRLLRDFRVGWRQLLADPVTSAIVVLGLAGAIACCQLALQMVFNEVLPDTEVPEPARVVGIEYRSTFPGNEPSMWFEVAPLVLGPALQRQLGAAAAVTRAQNGWLRAGVDGRTDDLSLTFVDPPAVPLFGLRALRGDLAATLRRPDAIALTRAAAVSLFGSDDAIGKVVQLRGRSLVVGAVIARGSHALMHGTQGLASFESPANATTAAARDSWFAAAGNVYARLAPGQSADDFGQVAQALFDRESPSDKAIPPELFKGRRLAELRALPITRRYLHGAFSQSRRLTLAGLVASTLLVLALAVANHLNLSMVRTLARSREIAVRKSLGADPRRLVVQFVLEGAVAAAGATALGVLLAWLLVPTLSGLLQSDLATRLFAPGRLAALAAFALLLGGVAGLLPAHAALGVRCAETLAGRPHDEGRGGRRVRRALTTLQFTIALVISGAACLSAWQSRFVDGLELGFRRDGLVAVDLPPDTPDPLARSFRDALARQPAVAAIAWSDDVPGRNHFSMSATLQRGDGAPRVDARMSTVDAPFFEVYGVRPLAGRVRAPPPPASGVTPDDARGERLAVIDTAALHALGFATPAEAVGALVRNAPQEQGEGSPVRIVAVVPPLRMETAREARRPQMFWMVARAQPVVTVRGADTQALKQAIEATWPRYFPVDWPRPETVDESLQWVYGDERRVLRLTLAASVFALALAGFGVYALAAFTVRRSLREIVVRKLYGASRARIAGLLARDVAPLLAVAALLGLPLTGWLVQAWLAGYVERTPLAWWALPAALLAVTLVTLLAALRHGLSALRVRPAAALRD